MPGMSGGEDSISFLAGRLYGHLLEQIRVSVRSTVAPIEIPGIRLRELREGEVEDLPRWVALTLQELGLVEINEEPIDTELLKALGREKILQPQQLSKLPRELYSKLMAYLRLMKERAGRDMEARKAYERFMVSFYDLVNLRLGKILAYAALSSPPADLPEKLTYEELYLFKKARELVQGWRDSLMGEGP